MQTASLVREFAVDPYALFVIALPETETARTVRGLKPQTTSSSPLHIRGFSVSFTFLPAGTVVFIKVRTLLTSD